MTATTSVEHQANATSDVASDFSRPIEAAIRTLEQQASDLDEAHYEALREARAATHRAAELRLQALETRMRLCALVECERINAPDPAEAAVRYAVLRLTHAYFDEPGKYRLVLYTAGEALDQASDVVPDLADTAAWYSKVVYDAARPEGKCPAAICDAVRAAYVVAEQHGYRLLWVEKEAHRQLCAKLPEPRSCCIAPARFPG